MIFRYSTALELLKPSALHYFIGAFVYITAQNYKNSCKYQNLESVNTDFTGVLFSFKNS